MLLLVHQKQQLTPKRLAVTIGFFFPVCGLALTQSRYKKKRSVKIFFCRIHWMKYHAAGDFQFLKSCNAEKWKPQLLTAKPTKCDYNLTIILFNQELQSQKYPQKEN